MQDSKVSEYVSQAFGCNAYSRKQNYQTSSKAGRARSTVDVSSADAAQGVLPRNLQLLQA
jgi:hypothetical protein